MHTLTNALIFNQAVIDLFGSVVLLLESNVPVPETLHDTPANWILCHIWLGNLLLWGAFNASTLNLLSVTLERFFAIVFPLRYCGLFTRRVVIVLVCCSWIMGVFLQGLYISVVHVFSGGKCYFESSGRTQLIGAIFICIKFFLPVFIMVFAYASIMFVLKKGVQRLAVAPRVITVAPVDTAPRVVTVAGSVTSTAPPAVETRDNSLRRARRNTFKTLLIVFISFLVCWAPNQIVFFLFNLGWPLDFGGNIYVISVSLVAVNSCINPIIYGIKYKRFREGVRKLLGRRQEESNSFTM
ncbi:dopamine receptor 1-like [Asterias rubens]|uniref:dopamine receptor 1-like n=1 Tax=Asterias rubens TaxID=7604 RepID=UPI0014552516|nr:dopamine receptor 1-like [Asterias rubens]